MKRLLKKSKRITLASYEYETTGLFHTVWDGTKSTLGQWRDEAERKYDECYIDNDEDEDGECIEVSHQYIRGIITPDNKVYAWLALFHEHLEAISELGYSREECATLMIDFDANSIDVELMRANKTKEQEQTDIEKLLPEWTINVKEPFVFPNS